MNESKKDKQNQDHDAMAKCTVLEVLKKEWRRIEPTLVKYFVDKGMSGEQARLKVAHLKPKLQTRRMKTLNVMYYKILNEEVNREVEEQNNSQESGSLVRLQVSESSTAASNNNESNAPTYPVVASRVLAPAKAKSSGDRGRERPKGDDNEEPPVKRAKFKK